MTIITQPQTDHPGSPTGEKSAFIRSLRGEVLIPPPIWLMRQAGRYLPEYNKVRSQTGEFLDLCYHPENAAEVTLQPIRRFDLDAAIIFSDILVIPHALGQDVTFVKGEGPKLDALHKAADIDRLGEKGGLEENLAPVYQALRLTREALPDDKALIGFAGAPWTLACYMLQGYGDGAFKACRDFAAAEEKAFDSLMQKLVTAVTQHLVAQVRAGADAVQIFDSWAGLLAAPADKDTFTRYVVNLTRDIVAGFRTACPDTPVIGFARGAGVHYADYAEKTGVNALGLDQNVLLADKIRDIPARFTLQGNLDPQILLQGGDGMKQAAENILRQAQGRAFVFNLGHGVIKETPPDHVADLVRIVREYHA